MEPTDKALQIFEQIVSICYQIDHPKLSEIATYLLQEAERANSPEQIQLCSEELTLTILDIEDELEEEEELLIQLREFQEELQESD
jgi:hypothetical protein